MATTVLLATLLGFQFASGRLNIDLPPTLSEAKSGKPASAAIEKVDVSPDCVADPLPTDLFSKIGGSAPYGGPQDTQDGSIRFSGDRFVKSDSVCSCCFLGLPH